MGSRFSFVALALVLVVLVTGGCGDDEPRASRGRAEVVDPCSDAADKPPSFRAARAREVIGVRWRYLQVGDCRLAAGDPTRHDLVIYEDSIHFRADDCNSTTSRYSLRRGGMQFSGSSSTLIACGGAHVSPQFVDGTKWRLSWRGDLYLLSPKGDVILAARRVMSHRTASSASHRR